MVYSSITDIIEILWVWGIVLIMSWYYICWTSYPTIDNKRVQVDEALLSIDKNIYKWLLTSNNKYSVLLIEYCMIPYGIGKVLL